MKRSLPEEPLARSAVWTRRLAVMGGLLGLAAVALAQRGSFGFLIPLWLLSAGLALAGLAALTSIAAAVAIWRTGHRGTGRVAIGLLLVAATLAYPAYVGAAVVRHPLQPDLSTDPGDPPRFSLSSRAFAVRGDLGGAPWMLPATASRPPAAGDLEPQLLDLSAPDAFAAVTGALKTLRWRVLEAVAPGGRSGLGHVDATRYSPVMHLPEEIAIRIRPLAGQTRIDIRAMSRRGLPDFGDNARNIRALVEALQDAADDK